MNQYLTKQHDRVLAGIQQVRDVVASTFGPSPMNVTISAPGGGASINDGVRVIQQILFSDPEMALGADRIRRAAEATHRATGDGTTSTALLMAALYEAMCTPEFFGSDHDLHGAVEQVEFDAQRIVANLKLEARKCDNGSEEDLYTLKSVARVAMHGHPWADDIATLLWQLGKDGAFGVEVSKTGVFQTERIEGFRWDAGLYSMEQCNRVGRFEANDAYVAILAGEITDLKQITGVLSTYRDAFIGDDRRAPDRRPLVLVAQAMSGNALSALVNTRMSDGQGLPIVLVRCPGQYGYEVLADMAAVVGTKIFDKTQGVLADLPVLLSSFGKVSKVTVTNKTATFVPADETVIAKHAAVLEEQATVAQGEAEEQIRQRIANLKGLYGVIRIAVSTETEFAYLREMTEDCYRAVQSALVHGVLPGGGRALFHVTRAAASFWKQIGDVIPNALGCVYDDEADGDLWEEFDRVNVEEPYVLLDNAGSVCESLLNATAEACALAKTQYFIINPLPSNGQ